MAPEAKLSQEEEKMPRRRRRRRSIGTALEKDGAGLQARMVTAPSWSLSQRARRPLVVIPAADAPSPDSDVAAPFPEDERSACEAVTDIGISQGMDTNVKGTCGKGYANKCITKPSLGAMEQGDAVRGLVGGGGCARGA